jgi:hypothetical protein
MKKEKIKISYNTVELGSITSTLIVEFLGENHFKMIDNDTFIKELTLGTEFKTKTDSNGLHEIIAFTHKSSFITKRYTLNSQYNESDYRMIGDEIAKYGGFWQVDFGSLAIVNIPPKYLEEFENLIQNLGLDFMESE